jgi:hypothetical protein
MKFVIASSPAVRTAPRRRRTVEWHGAREDGRVELAGQELVLHVPTAGTLRAWSAQGTEIWFGPVRPLASSARPMPQRVRDSADVRAEPDHADVRASASADGNLQNMRTWWIKASDLLGRWRVTRDRQRQVKSARRDRLEAEELQRARDGINRGF